MGIREERGGEGGRGNRKERRIWAAVDPAKFGRKLTPMPITLPNVDRFSKFFHQ